jgi:hypothetical protein
MWTVYYQNILLAWIFFHTFVVSFFVCVSLVCFRSECICRLLVTWCFPDTSWSTLCYRGWALPCGLVCRCLRISCRFHCNVYLYYQIYNTYVSCINNVFYIVWTNMGFSVYCVQFSKYCIRFKLHACQKIDKNEY